MVTEPSRIKFRHHCTVARRLIQASGLAPGGSIAVFNNAAFGNDALELNAAGQSEGQSWGYALFSHELRSFNLSFELLAEPAGVGGTEAYGMGFTLFPATENDAFARLDNLKNFDTAAPSFSAPHVSWGLSWFQNTYSLRFRDADGLTNLVDGSIDGSALKRANVTVTASFDADAGSLTVRVQGGAAMTMSDITAVPDPSWRLALGTRVLSGDDVVRGTSAATRTLVFPPAFD